MPKATKPVSIEGIEFDALISSEHKLVATVPEYPTDYGFSVSDSIVLEPETLSMVLYLTDTPVTWYARHGNQKDRVKRVCDELERLYYNKSPVKVITSEKTYNDMAIESISINKSIEEGYSREIPISFRKIRTTKAQAAEIPSYYGKSGPTQESVGTANTTTEVIGVSDDEDYFSNVDYSMGAESSKENSSFGSSGSILYNLGKSSGIIK